MRGTGGIVKVLFAVSSVVSPACIPGPALWASQEHSGGAAERADERQEEKRQEVPPETRTVVVTASRREMPLGEVSDVLLVIPRGAIEEIRPSAVGELLGYVPGTSVETGTGSGLPKRSVVSLNGLPASYTLVLVDGQRLLGEHIHTGQNLELVPPECIERIEIIRGAASAQYGSDAIGGVVNIITRKCGKAPRTFVGASAGSYHTYGGDVAVLKPFEDWARATIFLSREQSDGVPIEAPASRVGNMGYERNFGTARLHADMGPSTEAFGWVHAADNTADWRGAVADSAMLMTGLGLTHKFSPEVDFNLRLPCSKWEAEVNGERNLWVEPGMYMTFRSRGGHTLLAGAEFRRNEFSRAKVDDVPAQDAFAAYFQYDRLLDEGMTLSGAVRLDDVEDVEPFISPKVSFLWATDFVPGRLRASVSRGFHAPTLQEMYEEGFGHGSPALRFGNPFLDPERSLTGALGLEVFPVDELQFSAYGHYSRIDDMIIPVYEGPWVEDPAYDVWRRTNIAEARVWGVELAAGYALVEGVRIEGGFTYADSEDRESGRQLPYHAGYSAFAKLTVEISLGGGWKASGFAGLRAVFDRSAWNWKPPAGAPAGDPSGMVTELEDYQKLDAGISLTHSSLTVFINAYNILGQDIEYLDDAYTIVDGEPSVKVGFRWEF